MAKSLLIKDTTQTSNFVVLYMKSKEFDKISDAARRKISKQRGWHQTSYMNWTIKKGYFFGLFNSVLTTSTLEVKPVYVDTLWWEIFCPGEKMSNSLRANGAFSACPDSIVEINVFPRSKPTDYPIEFFDSTWNRVFCEAETHIDNFISEHPDAEKYFIDNQRQEILYLMPRIHNEMHKEVIDYIAERFANGEHGSYGSGGKMTFDYIIEWYEQHYPGVIPQSLINQINKN